METTATDFAAATGSTTATAKKRPGQEHTMTNTSFNIYSFVYDKFGILNKNDLALLRLTFKKLHRSTNL